MNENQAPIMTSSKKKRLYWRASVLGVAILSVLTFTPIVTPSGEAGPFLAGIPRTLWAGILITVGLVVLTAIATRVYPVYEKQEGDDQ